MSDPAWNALEAQAAALHALLLRLTLRPDAADELLQELLLKLSQSSRFAAAPQREAYARRSAINLAMDWRRTRKRDRRIGSIEQEPLARERGPGASIEDAEEIAGILDAVEGLSDLAREAFVLRFVQQESYQQIGQLIGKTPHQARALCHAAIKQMREQLAPRAQRLVTHERD